MPGINTGQGNGQEPNASVQFGLVDPLDPFKALMGIHIYPFAQDSVRYTINVQAPFGTLSDTSRLNVFGATHGLSMPRETPFLLRIGMLYDFEAGHFTLYTPDGGNTGPSINFDSIGIDPQFPAIFVNGSTTLFGVNASDNILVRYIGDKADMRYKYPAGTISYNESTAPWDEANAE